MKHRLLLTSTVIGVTLGFAAEAHAAPTDAAGQNKLATAGAGASNSSSAGATQTQMTPQEQQQLLQEVRSLRERVSVLENKVTAVQSTPPLAKEHKAGDHNLELYGFIQLDAIQDFKRVNPNWDATLRPSRIPTAGRSIRQRRAVDLQRSPITARCQSHRHAGRQAVRGEVRVRPLMVSARTQARRPFAYGMRMSSWGPFLAGQTNSLFMDGDMFPNIDRLLGPGGHGLPAQSAAPLDLL